MILQHHPQPPLNSLLPLIQITLQIFAHHLGQALNDQLGVGDILAVDGGPGALFGRWMLGLFKENRG